jgi:hypothetical protein
MSYIFGIEAHGENAFTLAASLLQNIPATNLFTLSVGGAALGFLIWSRKSLQPLIVVDRNLFAIPAKEIWEAQVLLTLLGGETVYGDAAALGD